MSEEGARLFERFGREFPVGSVVFSEGEIGNEMYVIQSGKVQVSKKVRGVEKELVVLGPGAFFGEMAIINEKPRSATVKIVDPARLLVIGPKTFETMIRGNAEIALRMIKILAQRLAEADAQIENLMLRDHNSRVVQYLTHLASRGKQMPGGTLVAVDPEGLAQKIGLQVAQVREVLDKLFKAKLIREHDDGLLIHDVGRLREFLEFLEMKEKFGDI